MKTTIKSKEIKNFINEDIIISHLKQKGFNEAQIKDILETFNSEINEECADKNEKKLKNLNYKKIETFNKRNLKINQASFLKKQNSNRTNVSKNNKKMNYLKLNIKTSSNKITNCELNTKNKNDLKVINLFKKRDEKSKCNNSYSKKYKEARNIKIGNYLKKFKSQTSYATNINSSKKSKDKEKTDFKNNKLKIIPINRKNNQIKLKIKFNNSTFTKESNDDIMKKNKNFSFKNKDLNQREPQLKIKKEKKFQKDNKDNEKNYLIKKCLLSKDIYSKENEFKIVKNNSNNQAVHKIIKVKKITHKDDVKKNLYKKLIPISLKRNKESNILKIRKQNSLEEDIIANKNTGITEIKISSKANSSRYTFNNYNLLKNQKQEENNFRFNTTNDNQLKKINSNYYNHNFVNINLCKNKIENNTNKEKDKFLNKRNSFPNFKCQISIKNDKNKRQLSQENKINLSKNNEMLNNKNDRNEINEKIYFNNNNSSKEFFSDNKKIKEKENDNIIDIKLYDLGKYEGIILNNKRELKGVMLYNDGARYEGEWKDDKKNGKGIYISPHYFNCEKNIGLKYEGEFLNDKFEGFGIALYSNGDKYEGEWKNNKKYGRGILTNIEGTKYIGDWKDGICEGYGIYYMNNGERYEGHFSNNKYNGYGKYFYNNGNFLEGIFKDDNPTPNCILNIKNELII